MREEGMRRGLVLCLVLAIMVAAGTASAEVYASLRLVGNGNFFLRGSLLDDGTLEIVNDSGVYTAKEVALGFGETFQGEVSFGFDSLTATQKDVGVWMDDEYVEVDEFEESAGSWWIGAAGFYEVLATQNATIDAGLRFQYLGASTKATVKDGGEEGELKFEAKGWSVGPVVRHTWMLFDDKIGIGPEVSLRYTSATSEFTTSYTGGLRASVTEDGPEYKAWDIDYSLRMDFFF
jgi:hypothetical protein